MRYRIHLRNLNEGKPTGMFSIFTLVKRQIKSTKYFELLTLSLSVARWAGANTDLPPNSNISKTVRVNIAFTRTFFLKSKR